MQQWLAHGTRHAENFDVLQNVAELFDLIKTYESARMSKCFLIVSPPTEKAFRVAEVCPVEHHPFRERCACMRHVSTGVPRQKFRDCQSRSLPMQRSCTSKAFPDCWLAIPL